MPKVTSPVAPPTVAAVSTPVRPAAATLVADASLDTGWRGTGPAAPAREPSVVPAATDPAVASNVKVLNLSGTTLEPGRPLVLDGLDPNRAIAYVEAEALNGRPVQVSVGAENQGSLVNTGGQIIGFKEPIRGEAALNGNGAVLGRVTVHYADPSKVGFSDYYSIVPSKSGLKNGETLTLPIPPERQGQTIQNIGVSYHAPVRDYDMARKWENKPTYADFYTGDRMLQHKFVDPNADAGNIPEIDNVYDRGDGSSPGNLGAAQKNVRIIADSTKIPADEQAMTVQWVRVTYAPKDTEVKTYSFRGEALPNMEWKGKWVQPGERFGVDVDPNKKLSRVEVQWSDKPDDTPYSEPGKWARGGLLLDGRPIGSQHEHVGSPEWKFFDGLGGAQGRRLEFNVEACPIKFFEIRVHYEGEGGADGPGR